MKNRHRFHHLGRTVAAILWFRVDGGWIYYVILAAYAAVICAGVWLLTRHWWLPVIAGFVVLLDGMTGLLVLLNRWLTRRSHTSS
jgi:hypothetical protein